MDWTADVLKEGFFTLNKEVIDLTPYLEYLFPIDFDLIDTLFKSDEKEKNNLEVKKSSFYTNFKTYYKWKKILKKNWTIKWASNKNFWEKI